MIDEVNRSIDTALVSIINYENSGLIILKHSDYLAFRFRNCDLGIYLLIVVVSITTILFL